MGTPTGSITRDTKVEIHGYVLVPFNGEHMGVTRGVVASCAAELPRSVSSLSIRGLEEDRGIRLNFYLEPRLDWLFLGGQLRVG